MRCRTCGFENPEDTRFCGNCGAPQIVGNDGRRVVTAMFADIVGFTALAELLDPEEAKHIVDRCFERLIADITSFGGVIDKVLGDGLVALFGAPVAHEDDAERAVRAGLAMQKSMAELGERASDPLQLRVGINTGEVLVGGSKAGGDYTAMGDVMNTASRLEGQAKPGDVLVGENTYAATSGAINYEPTGDLQVKGRGGLVSAYIAISARRAPGEKANRATPFVGRVVELELLTAQARLGLQTNRAQLSLVVGGTGLGKTRLVTEAANGIVSRSGARVLIGRCIPYGEANVWWPFADIIRRVWNFDVDLSNVAAHAQLKEYMDRAIEVYPDLDAERLTVALLHILGYETNLRGGDRINNRREVIYAVTTVLSTYLDDGPVVLILSDYHWAPEPVRMVVAAALDALARRPLVVFLTSRSTEDAEFSETDCGFVRIQLESLDAEVSKAMLAGLGLDLGEEAANEFFERSGGNPFFIEELAGLISSSEEASGPKRELTEAIFDTVPSSLRGLVAARLDRLDSKERALLDDAAVLGRSGYVGALADMARYGRDEEDIRNEFDTLVREDFLEVVGSRFSFKSDLVREVAYQTLTKADRARKHAKIAEFLEQRFHPGDRSSIAIGIASHYRSAAVLSSELLSRDDLDRSHLHDKAIHWLDLAGELLFHAGEPIDAERFYDSALLLDPSPENRAKLLYGRARSNCELHELTRSMTDLDELTGMVDPESALGSRVLVVRGDVERKRGHYEAATSSLTRAAKQFAKLDMGSDQAYSLRILGLNELEAGNREKAGDALRRSRDVATKTGDRRSEAWALQSLAYLAFQSRRPTEAGELIEAAIESFTAINDKAGIIWSLGLKAWVSFQKGDWRTAETLVRRILPEANRRGEPWAYGMMLALDASLLLWSGHATEAQEVAQRCRSLGERAEDWSLTAQGMAIEGRSLVSLGRVAEGTELLETATSMSIRRGDKPEVRFLVTANATSAARVGDHRRAQYWAQRYYESASGSEELEESDLAISVALAHLHAGQASKASEVLGQAKEDWGSRWYLVAVESLLDATKQNLAAVETAAEFLAPVGTYLDRVFSLWALALAQLSAGIDPNDALNQGTELLRATDDQVTKATHHMVVSLCSGASLSPAEDALRGMGVDPAGWSTLFTSIVGLAKVKL